jgi:hypothetical protein
MERYEKIDKLRTLGVEVTPIAAVPSTEQSPVVTSLRYYFASPSSDPLTISEFTDPAAEREAFVQLNIAEDIPEPTELNGLFIHTVNATTPIPTSDLLPIPEDLGFARLSYGLEAVSGDEEEKVVGRILVYKPEDEKVSWQQPTVELLEPADGATLSSSELDIKASIESDYEEEWRVSWFVTDGKITNRRAKETKWEEPGTGDQTLILTVRGLNSNTFVIKTAKVTFE